MRGGVVLNGQANLLELIFALRPPCRLTGRLNRWEQQGHQNADDRDHDQQLDQRKTTPTLTWDCLHDENSVAPEKRWTSLGSRNCILGLTILAMQRAFIKRLAFTFSLLPGTARSLSQ